VESDALVWVRLSSLTIAEGQQDVRLESLTYDAGETP